MNDIKNLLATALNEEPHQMTTQFTTPAVDPSADLTRGQAHLRRRRLVVLSGAAAAVLLAGGVGAVTLSQTGGGSAAAPVASGAKPATAPAQATAPDQAIVLVAYTWQQPQGYKVSWIPDGWVIQGASATSLTIAPKDATDKDPDSFLNKLTVLSASSDQPVESLTRGNPVKVGTQKGYLVTNVDPGRDGHPSTTTQILSYKDVSGRWVQVQVPGLLHWDAKQIARFASGVTVLKGAADTHG
jgi:hypothetical protein